jgi:uncharacterized protein
MQTQYDLLLTSMTRSLEVASHLLDKAAAHVSERGIHEHELLQATLAPDMFSFIKQIQLVSDAAKGYPARILGQMPVSISDTESTIEELQARIAKTKEIVAGFKDADFSKADDARISFPWMAGKYFLGREFVLDFAIPNLYFHLTTAYAILRNQGVTLGKMDFLMHTKMHNE